MNPGIFDTATFEANDIESLQPGAISNRHSERDDIVLNTCQSPYKGSLADTHELMQGAVRADGGIIVHVDVPGELRAIHKYGVVADHAIVGDVRVGHD